MKIIYISFGIKSILNTFVFRELIALKALFVIGKISEFASFLRKIQKINIMLIKIYYFRDKNLKQIKKKLFYIKFQIISFKSKLILIK